MDVLVQPVTLLCGHTFDRFCLRTLQSCPLCRRAFDEVPQVNSSMLEICKLLRTEEFEARNREIVAVQLLWAAARNETDEIRNVLNAMRVPLPDDLQEGGLRTALKWVDVNHKFPCGTTAIYHVCKDGKGGSVKTLLEFGATITDESIYATVANDHKLVLLLLLKREANAAYATKIASKLGRVDVLSILSGYTSLAEPFGGKTPLYIACMEGQTRAARFLACRSDVNALCDESTALCAACERGHLGPAKVLLDAGADPDLGYPLHLASENNRAEIVELLIQAGADIRAVKGDRTPCETATALGHLEVVKVFRRANVEAPLSLAIENGRIGVAIHFLLF